MKSYTMVISLIMIMYAVHAAWGSWLSIRSPCGGHGFRKTAAGLTLRIFQKLTKKCCLCNEIRNWLDFQVFSDKDYKLWVLSHNPSMFIIPYKTIQMIRPEMSRSVQIENTSTPINSFVDPTNAFHFER